MFSSGIVSRLSIGAAALAFALGTATLFAAEPVFQLKDNDVWVMAGDSITAQRLHTNYIEAFYRTKHPQWHLHFRNSGIGGNRTGSVLARFDYDVAAWKPTIVSIELGMNDVNGPEEAYIKGMKELIAKIRAIPAQPVLISSSPVDDGSMMNDWKGDRCRTLHPFQRRRFRSSLRRRPRSLATFSRSCRMRSRRRVRRCSRSCSCSLVWC